MKAREFWITISSCTGKEKAYKTELECWNEIQQNEYQIHVREVKPIDWKKIWKIESHILPIGNGEYQQILQELIEL